MPYEKVGKEVRCIADEIPFEIPDSWEWVTLRTIAISELGKTLDKAKNTGNLHQYLCSINVYWNKIDLSKVKEARFEATEHEKYLLRQGDLLVCEGGDIGRCAVWEHPEEMYYQNALHRIRFYGNINPYFFQILLECYKANGIIDEYSKGMTIKHLVQSALNSIKFPLPPLAEQKRIVAKIEELLPHIEEYGKAESRVSKLNAEFPEQLKKSILQWAIQGKLVPQNPNDEPASVLLERIRAEKAKLIKEGKIKKDKNESIIFRRDNSHYEKLNGIMRCIDDEIPFEIPDSWEWVTLRTIAISELGKTLDKAKNTGNLHQYLCSINVYWNKIDLSKVKEARFEATEHEKYLLRQGDLLVCEGGDIGRCAVWEHPEEMYYQNALHRIRFYGNINPYFFQILLECYKANGIIDEYSKGMTIKHLVQSALNSIKFPLPPLAEQKRIVAEIEKIFKIQTAMRSK